MSEIQWIIWLKFSQISDLTFIASDFQILFLQCTTNQERQFNSIRLES